MRNDWKLLEELCNTHAVCGREDRLTRLIADMIEPLADVVEIDRLGNVIGILKGKQFPDHKLMLQAHMDESGLIVRNITPDGFILFERIGGPAEKSILAQRMQILTENGQIITGYVGTKSVHTTSAEDKFRVPGTHELFIDVGLPSAEAVEKSGIQIGDPIAYNPNFQRFGDGMICSKALDNRISIYLLIQTLKHFANNRPESTLVFAFTVLEEFSIRGSLPTVNRTQPDAIISLDITITSDTPIDDANLSPVRMGKGPSIKMMDYHGKGTMAGLVSSPPLRRFIERVAAEKDIPLQREVMRGLLTDPAFQIYLGDKGYTAAGISIPHRYSHAPTSTVHESDVNLTADLLIALSQQFNPSIDLRRGIL
ncbi:MAG: hypothetical protein JEZ06_00570 [Anaerolineaceae bacterium]|nr:hypothetical protein [Anaerolineaceae bacterium]